MKQIKLLIGTLLLSSSVIAQGPIGSPPTNPNNTNQTASSAWYRGGNDPGGIAGTNNIFGTMWNSPIYTYTNGVPRMIVNGTKSQSINNHTFDRSGFIGIGSNSSAFLTDVNKGPFSLLHLNGSTPAAILDKKGEFV